MASEAKRIIAIVQARMSSTRLPGKVLRDLCGRPMVWHVLERVARVERITQVVLACSDHPADDVLADFVSKECRADLLRGSETDVLSRYYQAAQQQSADVVIRVTADCPLISPLVINQVLDVFLAGDYDYVSNTQQRSFPHGLDVEIIPMQILQTAYDEAEALPDREHVMPFMWRQPERFRLCNVAQDEDLSHLRWTVDTPADFSLVQHIYQALYPTQPNFDWPEVCALLAEHPMWSAINADVQQKKYGE